MNDLVSVAKEYEAKRIKLARRLRAMNKTYLVYDQGINLVALSRLEPLYILYARMRQTGRFTRG